jgi:hypothetical protein
MSTTLLPEIVRSMRQVIVQHDPASTKVEDAEVVVRLCLNAAHELETRREVDRQRLREGLEGAEARELLEVALGAFAAWSELADAAAAWGNHVAHLRQRPVEGLDQLQNRARRLDEERKHIHELLAFAGAPHPPVDPKVLAEGEAALARGECEDTRDILARLRAGGEF